MGKSKTSTFCVKIRILTSDGDAKYLDKVMDACTKIYNAMVKHVRRQLYYMNQDPSYRKLKDDFFAAKDSASKRDLRKAIKAVMKAHRIDESELKKYVNYQRHIAFEDSINNHILQELATIIAGVVENAVFKNTEVHYRNKDNGTNSFQTNSRTGILFFKDKHIVKINGKTFNLVPIRKSDTYLIEALQHTVKYCRVKREYHNCKNKYFLQIVLEGTAPIKYDLGKGKCGIDQGTTTVAYYNKTEAGFFTLAEGVEKYNKLISYWSRVNERRRRMANPAHYDASGRPIKASEPWIITNGMRDAKQHLRSVYRLKHAFVTQCMGRDVRRILTQCEVIIKEPMNFAGLAKKAKGEPELTDKTITKVNAKGKTKTVKKYKKKTRYGRSIQNRAPGMFNLILERKCRQLGGIIIDVDIFEYRASQRDHTTNEIIKPSINDRIKTIKGNVVQRDLYSAFLLYHFGDSTTPNYNACKRDFKKFLQKQEIVIEYIKQHGDSSRNFGIKNFK